MKIVIFFVVIFVVNHVNGHRLVCGRFNPIEITGDDEIEIIKHEISNLTQLNINIYLNGAKTAQTIDQIKRPKLLDHIYTAISNIHIPSEGDIYLTITEDIFGLVTVNNTHFYKITPYELGVYELDACAMRNTIRSSINYTRNCHRCSHTLLQCSTHREYTTKVFRPRDIVRTQYPDHWNKYIIEINNGDRVYLNNITRTRYLQHIDRYIRKSHPQPDESDVIFLSITDDYGIVKVNDTTNYEISSYEASSYDLIKCTGKANRIIDPYEDTIDRNYIKCSNIYIKCLSNAEYK